jgi:uncharacterized protein YceK
MEKISFIVIITIFGIVLLSGCSEPTTYMMLKQDINWSDSNVTIHFQDTNWQTSYPIFDTNLSAKYARISDVNYSLSNKWDSNLNQSGLDGNKSGSFDLDTTGTGTFGLIQGLKFKSKNATSVSGADAVAFGNQTTASNTGSFSAGYSSVSGGLESAGIGSIAMGYSDSNLFSGGTGSVALGYNTKATGDYSTAAGSSTTASGYASIAMGQSTIASGSDSTAMGEYTTASNYGSTAMGYYTTASGNYSTAMGFGTTASGDYSTAMGYYSIASGSSSTAMGSRPRAFGLGSFAAKYNNTNNDLNKFSANNSGAIAMGYADTNLFAAGIGSVALGYNAVARGKASAAIGFRALALDANSIAIGARAVSAKPNLVTLAQDVNVMGFLTVGAGKDMNTSLSAGDINASGKIIGNNGISSNMSYDINGTKGITTTIYVINFDTNAKMSIDINAGLITKVS